MKEIVLSLLAGIIIGIVFKFMKLPLPAPPVLAGVVGIFGVYFGGQIAEWLKSIF
ncbi:XapX domain-containing protein [Gracilibacillus thailandensis]|jgi:XapX domain-containing protein|uniref:DUF1427 family protein n=1 Tax=Gracilibacillus thailandensis TaxID=563735 RepID=A0A6N7R2S0_9BACI|nr:DUF1427 family protein [Gracilibacillus thailandensis]MRI65586.1 DUF1427 family protein [Gracilibacillus thailandensis]